MLLAGTQFRRLKIYHSNILFLFISIVIVKYQNTKQTRNIVFRGYFDE